MPVAGLWRSARRVNALSTPGLWRVCAGFKNHFEAVLSHNTLNTTVRPSLLNAPLHPRALGGHVRAGHGHFVALGFDENVSLFYILLSYKIKFGHLGRKKLESPLGALGRLERLN